MNGREECLLELNVGAATITCEFIVWHVVWTTVHNATEHDEMELIYGERWRINQPFERMKALFTLLLCWFWSEICRTHKRRKFEMRTNANFWICHSRYLYTDTLWTIVGWIYYCTTIWNQLNLNKQVNNKQSLILLGDNTISLVLFSSTLNCNLLRAYYFFIKTNILFVIGISRTGVNTEKT